MFGITLQASWCQRFILVTDILICNEQPLKILKIWYVSLKKQQQQKAFALLKSKPAGCSDNHQELIQLF